ncbi:MAG: NAD(P)/FAD-dependent oxidoreductase [Ignavibacteria bacterium]|nr:NAD(P)/FAD-dependent oxidoreductase [Ignavibacteria bacterium]
MSTNQFERRDFLKKFFGGLAFLAFDWRSFPKAFNSTLKENEFDAIIIGSGLGGLSCAAAFARQGFKPLVIEQHYKLGGYATTFERPGGFEFDASLHSTSVGERNGIHNLIPGFPEIKGVEFEPHPNLYRVIFPDYDIRVPQKNIQTYINHLIELFPEEKIGIVGIFKDMEGITTDISKFSSAGGEINMNTFPAEFPFLFKSFNRSWGDLVDARLKNPKLKAIVSSLWVYFGLPPSRLSPYYYAMPTFGYLHNGGYYPRGKSQKISNAFEKYIDGHGGRVIIKSRVEKILTKNDAACGVVTEDGKEFTAKVIISNANTYDTFNKMLDDNKVLKDYLAKLEKLSVSLSCFQIFLGLKKNLIKEIGITDTEIFYNSTYDFEADYELLKKADVENGGYAITLYDNIYKGYSPEGKNTLNIMTLQGFDHWEKYRDDYFKDNKDEYRKEKDRMADILIDKTENTLLPGLRDAIEVKEIGTPLTNIRYTSNYKGAVYGFDQTVENSGQNRLGHATPIKNLYLSGAWTKPGHGYGGVIYSGLQCFGEIMKSWK